MQHIVLSARDTDKHGTVAALVRFSLTGKRQVLVRVLDCRQYDPLWLV